MNAGVWVGQVVDAVRSRNAGALMARLDLRDATALTCVQRSHLNAAQLEMIAGDKFSASRVPNADKWATVATQHLLALQLCQQDKHLEAVDSYEAAAKALRYVFDNADDDTWLDQPVIDFVRNVVTLARRAAARPRQGERSGETLKRAGAEVLRVRVAAFRHSKVHVLLALTVQLYKLYVSMGAIFLMKDLHGQLRTVEADLKTCPVGDLCAYKFFRGMLQVLDEKWVGAEADLTLALRLCDARSARNRAAILSYLVPVHILRGSMPRADMLERHGLAYFAPVVAALKEGDPARLEAALDAEQILFMRRGIYLAMQKLHVLAMRMLLKRTLQCQREAGLHETQLSLEALTAICGSLGMSVDIDEVLCIVANQISRKLVKGYIALPQRVLVVQKGPIDKAFPKLTDASWA